MRVRVRHNSREVEARIARARDEARHFPSEAAARLGNYMYRLAYRYSSGTRDVYGYRPGFYSRARPAMPDDYIINVRNGLLRASWRLIFARTQRGARAILRNVARTVTGAPYPMFLFAGTRRMRRRPLPKKVAEQTARDADRVLGDIARVIARRWSGGA